MKSKKPRIDGRLPNALRPISIERGVIRGAAGSVVIRAGHTEVLCTASIEPKVPDWLVGKGRGWLTAEYDMLPASTGKRRPRNREGRLDGRTQEIQRLIGRCLRAVVRLPALGERQITIDCDVLQADGGTRTAAVTGAYVAVCDAVAWGRREGLITGEPIVGQVAAVSVGRVDGRALLDLCYEEDVAAEVDFNVAMTDRGAFVEVQGTAEGQPFTAAEMREMLGLAAGGIEELMALQRKALAARQGGRPSRKGLLRRG